MTLKEVMQVVAKSSAAGEVYVPALIIDLLYADMQKPEENISTVLECIEPDYNKVRPVMEFIKEREEE